LRLSFRRPQFIERHNDDAAHIIYRAVSDQTLLCITNGDSEISDYAVAIGLARIGIETCWKIHRKDERTLCCPHLIDGVTCSANRFAKGWFCTDAKQTIQNN